MVFLKWTEDRLKVIPILDKEGNIINNVVFLPQWNFVSDDIFNNIKSMLDNRTFLYYC